MTPDLGGGPLEDHDAPELDDAPQRPGRASELIRLRAETQRLRDALGDIESLCDNVLEAVPLIVDVTDIASIRARATAALGGAFVRRRP